MSPNRRTPARRFLEALAPFDQVCVVTHDNPDPDAIATGWAVAILVKERLGKKVRLVGGGEITRAENREMVKLLEPPIELVRTVRQAGKLGRSPGAPDVSEAAGAAPQPASCTSQPACCAPQPASGGGLQLAADTAVVLVDCQARNQNHILRGDAAPIVAVIDHHESPGRPPRLAFWDVRPNVAASATIAASYLREEKVEPPTRLATAMLFAIRTETRGSETHYCELDRTVFRWLSERANPSQLAEIESAPLPPGYYGDLILALSSTFIYGETAFCLLPRASGAEIVGEVADLLVRGENIWRVFCGAVVHEDLLVSVRTERKSDDATDLVLRTLAGLGEGGGHPRRAGGCLPNVGPRITEELENVLRSRWLDACGVDQKRGTRLVPRREIVENLS